MHLCGVHTDCHCQCHYSTATIAVSAPDHRRSLTKSKHGRRGAKVMLTCFRWERINLRLLYLTHELQGMLAN